MRRISLPNESEHGWEFNPESKEHVIESRLRRQEMMERGRREAEQSGPHRFKRGSLGLTEAEVTMIRWEAELQFFDGAKLSDELRNQRDQFRQDFDRRLDYFLKNGDRAIREVAESQTPAFRSGVRKGYWEGHRAIRRHAHAGCNCPARLQGFLVKTPYGAMGCMFGFWDEFGGIRNSKYVGGKGLGGCHT
jgi:hypothetical protein